MSQRLPVPGSDNGTWGYVLNGFLNVAHNPDGTLQTPAGTSGGTNAVAVGGGLLAANNLSDVSSVSSARSNLNAEQWLAPTAVQTSAYSANPADFVAANTSSGSFTVTLPTTPADKTRVGVKHVIQGSTNTVTITAGGSDVFNKAGGATSLTLSLLNQGVVLQYASSSGIWYVQADDLPLSQLDTRYVNQNTLGAASGVATLDAGSHLTASQLPSSVVSVSSSGVNIQNRQTNQIAIADLVSQSTLASIQAGTTALDSALTTAITSLVALGGGEVLLPFGTLRITTPNFAVPNKVVIRGQGSRPFNRFGQTIPDCTEIIFDYAASSSNHGFILGTHAGIKGVRIFYKQQVTRDLKDPTTNVVQAAPYSYGWAIKADDSQSYYISGNVVEDVMILNAYQGISMNRANQFRLVNIYGDPLKEGVLVDNCFDASYIEDVHFWPFYAKNYTAGGSTLDALTVWIRANCRAFHFRRADFITVVKAGCFGRNQAFYLETGSSATGGTWGDFHSCWADVCNVPIYADDVQSVSFHGGFFNGGGDSTGRSPIVTTSSDLRGDLRFIGTRIYAALVGVLVTSTTGKVDFNGCDLDMYSELNGTSDRGNPLWAQAVISTSTCKVSVSGRSGTDLVLPVGPDVKANGVKLPVATNDVTINNFNLATWTTGVPNNWNVTNAANITQITNGVGFSLGLGAGGNVRLAFTGTGGWVQRPDVFVMQFTATPTGTNGDASYGWAVEVVDATNNNVFGTFGTSGYAPDCGDGVPVQFNIPILLPVVASVQVRFNVNTTATSQGQLQITNLKMFRQAPRLVSPAQISMIKAAYVTDPIGVGVAMTGRGGPGNTIEAYSSIVPTAPSQAGNIGFVVGDVLIHPTSGAKMICTAASTLGTWREIGGAPKSGTHAARLTTTASDGYQWQETDTGLIYIGNGASWSILNRDGIVTKPSDQIVNNSNTLVNDSALLFPIEANEVWFVDAWLLILGSSANADWLMAFTGPAGCTATVGFDGLGNDVNGGYVQRSTANSSNGGLALGGSVSFAGGTVATWAHLIGRFVNSSTAGNVTFQWAQNTATAENNTVKAGSFLRLQRIS